MTNATVDSVHLVCICAYHTFSILRTSVIWGAPTPENAMAQVPYTNKEEPWVYKAYVGTPLISPEWAKTKMIPTPDTETEQRKRDFIAAYDEWFARPSDNNYEKMLVARDALAAMTRRPGIPNVK